MKANLTLHCGATKVDRSVVELVPTPAATKSWTPIPHSRLLEQVEIAVAGNGLEIVEEAHALSPDKARYFGLLQIGRKNETQNEYAYVVGVRNSHDFRFTASLAVGGQVFICDNLAFSGEITAFRKHTTFIERDLPGVTARAVAQLADKWGAQAKRYETYKGFELRDHQVHDIIIRLLDVQAIRTTTIPYVLKEWRHPRYAAFDVDGKTAWRFFNAVTQANQDVGAGIWALPRRTQALHAILDQTVGVFGIN